MRFQFDRGKKDGLITCMDERMKRKENVKRQLVERRVMSGRVKKTDRENGGRCAFRGQADEDGVGVAEWGDGCIAGNGFVMSGEKVEEYGENVQG